jgi:hypothetical protein
MKQSLSALLIVCLLAPTVPLLAQSSPGISIASMDRGAVRPFDRLVITGSGFLPATAAISVLFVPKQRGVPMVIPVHSATATQVEVIVPSFLDPATGDFGFGQADVQVVQVTSSQVMTSNVLSGLDVAPVPTLPGSLAIGRVTREFMKLSIDALAAASGSTFESLKSEQTALLAQIDAVVAKPGSSASVPTVDGTSFSLTTPMLKASDRLIAAYLTSIAPYTRAQRLGDGAHALADLTCVPGDEVVIIDLCSLRVSVFGGGRNWVGGLVAVAAGVTAIVAFSAAATLVAAVPLAVGGVVLAAAGASQVIYLAMTSTLVKSLQSEDSQGVPDSVRDHSRQWLDNVVGIGAIPIAMASVKAADSIELVARANPRPVNSSPKGGQIGAAPSLVAVSPTHDMIAFLGAGAPTSIGAPYTASNRTFAEARQAPADVAVFNGAYSGSLDLVSPDPLVTPYLGAPVAFSVAGGIITLTAPGGGTGTVSPSGRVVMTLPNCRVSGFLGAKTATGAAAGGGTVSCAGGGISGGGPWNATRAAR